MSLDNNNLIFIDKDLNYTTLSAESAHSLNRNHLKGWYCSAGLRSLYIDFDGNVFRGVCGEGGWMGNVNNPNGIVHMKQLSDHEWIECTKQVCSCGADMAIPKVKNKGDISKFFTEHTRGKLFLRTRLKDVDPIVIYTREHEMFKTITWDIGRKCNFDCWYCSSNSHNTFESVKNLDMFKVALSSLSKGFVNERTKFIFTGGEPTIYKDYLPFVKLLKEADHIIHTTTNGSNLVSYYSELAKYSDIVFSIHLNYVKQFGIEKFLNNIQAAIDTTSLGYKEDSESQHNWVIVRIMLDPGNLDIAREVYAQCAAQFEESSNFVLSVDLVHQTENSHLLHADYTDAELEWINSINAQ